MLEEIFTALTLALTGSSGLALSAAFAWGVVSVLLSPCHLSSIPLVIGYISTKEECTAGRTFLLALLFAVGILITIALLGVLTAAMGRLLGDIGFWGNLLVAVVFFVMGLALLDIVHLSWALPVGDSMRGRGFSGALVLGLLFGVGSGPLHICLYGPHPGRGLRDGLVKPSYGNIASAGLRAWPLQRDRPCRHACSICCALSCLDICISRCTVDAQGDGRAGDPGRGIQRVIDLLKQFRTVLSLKRKEFVTMARDKVLFVCIHNSARSQMAEAYLNRLGR